MHDVSDGDIHPHARKIVGKNRCDGERGVRRDH